MKRLVEILLLLLIPQVSYSGEHDVALVITSDCVSSVEVTQSIYTEGWSLSISLNEEAASEFFILTNKSIGNVLTIYDGDNTEVISAVVREPLPPTFVSSGIESKEQAVKSKKSILESTGKCGIKSILKAHNSVRQRTLFPAYKR